MKKTLGYCYFLFCRLFFRLYCPLMIKGRENLPAGSFILCSNHTSHMDAPVLMLATGLSFEKGGLVAAKDYFFDNRLRKMIMNTLMNLIPIDRKVSRSSLMKNISDCKNFIEKRKRYLIIYPEGTRSVTGEMQPFKRGSALIAQKLSLPIVPAHIDGTYDSLGKGSFFPKARKIRVKIGKPVLPDIPVDQLTEILEYRIKKLKDGI